MSVDATTAFRFDRAIAVNGYAWWYLDAISDDGREAVTIIAMLGSVFSPYYRHARRAGEANPLEHSAFNVVLYRERRRLWTMTERTRNSVRRTMESLAIGPSTMRWLESALRFEIDETTAPWPMSVRGEVRVDFADMHDTAHLIHPNGEHSWQPIAPRCAVEVTFSQPRVAWRGTGYFDMNFGSRALESDFLGWDWARLNTQRETLLLYDVRPIGVKPTCLALRLDSKGELTTFEPPGQARLPATLWGLDRTIRADAQHDAALVKTLESAPFYARSIATTRVQGSSATGVHEALSLTRFVQPWVQALLPVRAPRAEP
jgi:carotenoid 1,2-hydratase